jgi:hypothetical protein
MPETKWGSDMGMNKTFVQIFLFMPFSVFSTQLTGTAAIIHITVDKTDILRLVFIENITSSDCIHSTIPCMPFSTRKHRGTVKNKTVTMKKLHWMIRKYLLLMAIPPA